MTDQEIYDTVARHLLKQGRPAVDTGAGGFCRYRTPDGLKCAAGALIPDEDYTPELEGGGIWSRPYFKAHFPNQLELLGQLQGAHDDGARGLSLAEWRVAWMQRMRSIAAHRGLDASVLDEELVA